MRKGLFSPAAALSRFGAFMRRHYHAALFVLFLCAAGAAGFVFWKYAYLVVFRKVEVVVRPLKIKEGELQRIVDGMNARLKIQSEIQNKIFKDPFAKPPETPLQP